MRIKIDNFTTEDRQLLKQALSDTDSQVEFDIINDYQLRRIAMLLGQLMMSNKVETNKLQSKK